MDKKRYRNLNLMLIGFATISVGMFAYSNIYLPNFADKEKVSVYVAKQDIPANVDLEPGMFKEVKVSEDSLIPGSVTDLKQIEGRQLKGFLESGELLSTTRFSDTNESDGPLIAELLIPTTIPLQHNDTIRVYVQYKENGKIIVEELFHEKKVIAKDRINADSSIVQKIDEATSTAVSSSNEGNVVYVRLTDQEAMDYQEAVNTGTLYAVKVTHEEDESTLSSGVQVSKYDAKKEEETEKGGTTALYEVQKGDTVSTIAKKFTTTEERIIALNDGRTDFKVGEKIKVPGN